MGEIPRAGSRDEPPGQGDAERLGAIAPLGEGMHRRVVGIVDVPVLDVQVRSPHEPR